MNTNEMEIQENTLPFEERVLNSLYIKSKDGKIFTNLMELILKPENIMLAYKNLKSNKGSHTPGVDKMTIEDLNKLSSDELVKLITTTLRGKGNKYEPKPVRQKLIPKGNGKTRPLGIPTIIDRLCQQCIKQVLEPILEAKFSEHSYGFRPNRSVENCIAEFTKKINLDKNYYVVEFDIKGFFDNVNHCKLKKQLWNLGIRDTELLNKIDAILKAPIKLDNQKGLKPVKKGLGIVKSDKGTAQGGIISPLLANVVLNELDHYMESKWETHKEINCCKILHRKDGSEDKSHSYNKMRKMGIKEVYIVRYADDFRLLCKKRSDANYFKEYITKWLSKTLKLEVSPEKTRIVNLKRTTGVFLGFNFKLQKQKAKKANMVLKTHMSDKAKKKALKNLNSQIRKIQHSSGNRATEINKYNSVVMGIQNYYRVATEISIDLGKTQFILNRAIYNRLKDAIGKEKNEKVKLSKAIEERYGESQMMRYFKSSGLPLLPIGFIQTKKPMRNKRGANKYTPEGRKLLKQKEKQELPLMQELESKVDWDKPILTVNKLTLYEVQKGQCAITHKTFQTTKEIECHHRLPRSLGGTDEYANLILITGDVHKLIHCTCESTIREYLQKVNPDKKQLVKINQLRKLAGNNPIKVEQKSKKKDKTSIQKVK